MYWRINLADDCTDRWVLLLTHMMGLINVRRALWWIFQVGTTLRWVHVSSGCKEALQEGPITCSKHNEITSSDNLVLMSIAVSLQGAALKDDCIYACPYASPPCWNPALAWWDCIECHIISNATCHDTGQGRVVTTDSNTNHMGVWLALHGSVQPICSGAVVLAHLQTQC